MKKFILLGLFLVPGLAYANDIEKDIEAIKQDVVQLESHLEKLLKDAAKCVGKNVPSVGTLVVDGAFDACLRQSEYLAAAIKHLEKKNPVNGAIARDFSKALTVLIKMYFNVPVDQGGRLYDRADLYAQLVKVFSKVAGFAALYSTGKIDNAIALFLVNNGGDVLSQGVLDSGTEWRDNPSISFERFLAETYSVRNSIVSIPAKGGVSYAMGEILKWLNILDAAELATLVIANQVMIKRGPEINTATWQSRLPFAPGFTVSFVISVVKSLILTTTCKSAVAGVNHYLNNYGFALPFSLPSWGSAVAKKEEL